MDAQQSLRPMQEPSRRDFLYAGWLAGAGLTLGDFLRLEAQTKGTPLTQQPKAKSVIHIFMQGGFAHMDSFDPKPDSPLEYRGELETVATKLTGVRFSQHLKKIAGIADQLTVVRSMTHTEVDHGRGEHSMFTGYRPSTAVVYPSFGSVVSSELGGRNNLPPYICVPTQTTPFLGNGYLSTSFGPFALGSDPARPNFTVRDLSLPKGVDEDRFAKRKDWKNLVDDHFSQLEQNDGLSAQDAFYQRAYDLLSSKVAREAFDIKKESDKAREQYGIIGKDLPYYRSAGARFLIARRLIEAGTRFVTVSFGRWDTHSGHYRAIEGQMRDFDNAFAGLITDLRERGLLDSTLVLVTTEFGRTPKINTGAGRDHWPRVFSIVLAGGGTRKGYVHGASDALAAEPAQNALTVENYATTVYHLLGIDPSKQLMAPGNRPLRIVDGGKIVKDLLS